MADIKTDRGQVAHIDIDLAAGKQGERLLDIFAQKKIQVRVVFGQDIVGDVSLYHGDPGPYELV